MGLWAAADIPVDEEVFALYGGEYGRAYPVGELAPQLRKAERQTPAAMLAAHGLLRVPPDCYGSRPSDSCDNGEALH